MHTQLLIDNEQDESNYDNAWNELKAENENAATSVLEGTRELAKKYKDNGEPGQGKSFRTIDELHDGRFSNCCYVAATYRPKPVTHLYKHLYTSKTHTHRRDQMRRTVP